MKARLAAAAIALAVAVAHPSAAADQKTDIVTMDARQQKTTGLRTAPVARLPITSTMHIPGTIVFVPSKIARLRPYADARVIRLLVQPGQSVAAGSAVAELASTEVASAQAALTVQRAQLVAARTGIEVARAAWRRGVVLARDGSLAQAEADRRRLVLAQAVAQANAASAQVRADEAALTNLGAAAGSGNEHLVTPIAGIVADIGITPGDVAGPGTPNAAITIADLSEVEALLQVPEAGVEHLQVGQVAGVRLSSGGTGSWSGTIDAIGATIDPQARTLPVRIRLANPSGILRAGMFVDATLYDSTGRVGLVVPPGAIQMIGDRRVVFTALGNGRFRANDVTTGVQRKEWVEITGGLSETDQIVTDGSFALKSVMQSALLGGD